MAPSTPATERQAMRRRRLARAGYQPPRRRQVELEQDSLTDSDSGDDFDSIDSDDEFDLPPPPPPAVPGAGASPVGTPGLVTRPVPPPAVASSSPAVRTFTVGNGAALPTTLPGGGSLGDVAPPLNVAIPDFDGLPQLPESTGSSESSTSSTSSTSNSVPSEYLAPTGTMPSSYNSTNRHTGTATQPTGAMTSGADKEFNREDPAEIKERTANHVMIGGGSIGAFVGVCLMGWLAWRFSRRSKKRSGRGGGSTFPLSRRGISAQARAGKLLGSIPWVKDRPWAQKWHTLDDDTQSLPPTYEKAIDRQRKPSSEFGGHYGGEKIGPIATLNIPRLDTSVGSPPLAPMTTRDSTPSSAFTVSPVSTPEGNLAPPPAAHQPQVSINSLEGQHGGSWDLPLPPAIQNQKYRLSDISSLSSGFGDGNIVIPPHLLSRAAESTTQQTPIPQPSPAADPRQAARTSMTQSSAAGWSSRDTIYTQTSEDSPPRFRTLSSWVNQQTGRIHRAQQRARDGDVVQPGLQEGVPPVPGLPAGTGVNGLPAEPEFSMMMPDGEVPRRADEGFAR